MKYLKLFEQFNEGMWVDKFGSLVIPDFLTEEPDDDPDIAYDKGKEARLKNYEIDECPYSEPELKMAWIDGYKSED